MQRPRRTKDQIAFDTAMDDAEIFNASPEGQAQFEAIESPINALKRSY